MVRRGWSRGLCMRGLLAGFGSVLLALLTYLPSHGGRGLSQAVPTGRTASEGPSLPVPRTFQHLVATLPLSFEVNQGQSESPVRFLARRPGYTAFFLDTAVVVVFRHGQPTAGKHTTVALPSTHAKHTEEAGVRLTFLNANRTPHITGIKPLPGKSHYLLGNDPTRWRTAVPHYAQIRSAALYPGVELVFYGRHDEVEFDFVVAPGANPDLIRLGVEPVGSNASLAPLTVDPEGNLLISVAGRRTLCLQHPRIYQEKAGKRQPVAGQYLLLGREQVAPDRTTHKVGIQVAAYDREAALTIDPVLGLASALGGSNQDYGWDVAVDTAGHVYLTGQTESFDFPTTERAVQPQQSHREVSAPDGFVVKIDPTGPTLLYATYLGGSRSDEAYGIAVDAQGQAYVTGRTTSPDFPLVNPFQSTYASTNCAACGDAFVAKLSTSGDALLYSTYLGGSSLDHGAAIAVDTAGHAYVTGWTSSSDFPTANAFQASLGGIDDAFVAKLTPAGNGLVYASYLGGPGSEQGHDIAVDASGHAYLTGDTRVPLIGVLLGADLRSSGHSPPSGQREASQQPASPDFPLVNPVQRTFGGNADAFVVKVHPTGNSLLYSTYLGGGKQEQGSGIAVDAAGNAYVIGHTLTPFFPRTNTLQVKRHGCETVSDLQFNTFAAKLDPAGATLLYTVCLGHSVGQEIAVDAAGNASLLGYTRSRTFPLVNPVQATFGGGEFDVFVATLNAAGSALLFSTYLGGSHSETGEGIAVDPAGNLYIGGRTNSPDFPTTQASPELARSRSSVDENAFVAKIVVAGR